MNHWVRGSTLVPIETPLDCNPLPETLEDAERLAGSIERAVSRETSGGVQGLRVEVNTRGVLLTGRCHSFYTKQKAQHAAMGLSGAEELTNSIEVV
jgi:osmotically-inducible protein OsmY